MDCAYQNKITDQGYTDIQLEAKHVPNFNAHARWSGKCHAKNLYGIRWGNANFQPINHYYNESKRSMI